MASLVVIAALAPMLFGAGTAEANDAFDQGVAAYRAKAYGKARLFWEQALSAGDWDAARDLGQLYRRGQGVPADAARSAAYYQQAVDHEIWPAALNLAELYVAGQGVPHDVDKAKALLQAALDHGLSVAGYRLQQLKMDELRARPPAATPPLTPAIPPPAQIAPAQPPAEAVVAIEPAPGTDAPTAVTPTAWAHLGAYLSRAMAEAGWRKLEPPGLKPYYEDLTQPDGRQVVRLYGQGPEPAVARYCAEHGDPVWCEVHDLARVAPPALPAAPASPSPPGLSQAPP